MQAPGAAAFRLARGLAVMHHGRLSAYATYVLVVLVLVFLPALPWL